MEHSLYYIALGAFAGFFAGLLGVGGGVLLVPLLGMIFAAQGFPADHVLHLALGTSMATILFTAISSLRTHHGHGAVLWPVVRAISPGILLGAALGTVLARYVSSRELAVFIAAFMLFVAAQMVLEMKPRPSRRLPGRAGMLAVGTGIGGISALAAVGGGAMTVPFLLWCNVETRRAIGTSAAVGLPIALAGTAGYILNGITVAGLPAGSAGFVHLPALLWVVLASMPSAVLGARAAHQLPPTLLRRVFAALLLLLAAKLLISLR
jgi:uncharacterized membrane protein YfcA